MTATFVALPFLLHDRLGYALTDHWKVYVGALVVSLGITIPMIMKDHHQGRGLLIGIAVTMVLAAQLGLTFFGFSMLPVFVALVVYFAGFNFLEAGLPARLSMLADGDVRGASLAADPPLGDRVQAAQPVSLPRSISCPVSRKWTRHLSIRPRSRPSCWRRDRVCGRNSA